MINIFKKKKLLKKISNISRYIGDISNIFADISDIFADISNIFADISYIFADISYISPIYPIYRRYISNILIGFSALSVPNRYFGFPDIFPIFLPSDNQCSISFQGHPIFDISAKYRR